MKLFDVYPRYNITPAKAEGVYIYDAAGRQYLDLYGGHGVISIGHGHPHYKEMLRQQLDDIGFYSNAVEMPMQEELAEKLAKQSCYPDHKLFLCNSGAEANENAIKVASFHTGKRKVVAFRGSFHGRTAATLNVTDNPVLSAPINLQNFEVDFVPLNDKARLVEALKSGDVCAVIVEGIQGVGGLDMPSEDFLRFVSQQARMYDALLILDEIQSGYGRSGKFFAHQYAGIQADIITMAKGMGNGFPTGAVLIHPAIKATYGMLGTTFGGNYLACAAAIAVLDVFEWEPVMENVKQVSDYLVDALKSVPEIKSIKGKGLMLGVEFDFPIKKLRSQILYDHRIFTGSSANPNLLRILPPLTVSCEQIAAFPKALKSILG